MKAWLAIVLVAVVGLGTGVGVAVVRRNAYPWSGGALRVKEPPVTPGGSAGQPIVRVDRESVDFGILDLNTSGSHEFVLTNVGTAPLEVSPGPTSCKCTMSDLKENTILAPGKSTKVKLSWKSKGAVGAYRQTAAILTNDPNRSRVVLTVSGWFSVAARAVPSELVFSRVMADQPATGSVRLFGYRAQLLSPEVVEWEDQSTAKCFEAKFSPLSDDIMDQEEGAVSGCLLEITVKPGLPLGAFRQKISVATGLRDTPRIEVPIRGSVTSEISVVGPGWEEDDGLLMLGTVSSRQGAQRTLLIVAGGPHGKDLQFKAVEVVPGLLHVELGAPKAIRGGNATQTPLTITIPPGSPPSNHLGSEQGRLGRITIQTNHPHTPQLRIYVRFAVEG